MTASHEPRPYSWRGEHRPGVSGAAGGRLPRCVWAQGRLRRDRTGARPRARRKDRSDHCRPALPRRRQCRGRRLEGTGGERVRSGGQGGQTARLPDGAGAPRGSRAHLDGAFRRGPAGGAGDLRMPVDRRRHGSHAGPAHRVDHCIWDRAGGEDGTARHGAAGRPSSRYGKPGGRGAGSAIAQTTQTWTRAWP